MSWDGIIFRAPAGVSVNDLPKDFQLSPLGTVSEIGEILQAVFPDGQHTRGQCYLEGTDFWLELNFGYPQDKDIYESIGVRCNPGTGVLPILRQVCKTFEARLFDNQIGEFADLDAETESSMIRYSEWRDRALGKLPDDSQ